MYSVCQSLMCIRLVGTIIGNITRYRKALRKEIYLALRWSCISTTIDTREGIVIKKRQLQNKYPIMGEANHVFLWYVDTLRDMGKDMRVHYIVVDAPEIATELLM